MDTTLFTLDGKPVFTQVRSNFSQFLSECLNFWDSTPAARAAFADDLHTSALIDKRQRTLERMDAQGNTPALPGLEQLACGDIPCSLTLETGRPRMSAKLVFLFSMIRGWFGNICSSKVMDALVESQSLAAILDREGVKLPGATTILENINAIDPLTLERVMQMQLGNVRERGLDDFELLSVDSTAVRASSEWPTESKIIHKLLARVLAKGERLKEFELSPMRCACSERWIEQIRKTDFEIALCSNKAGAVRKRKKLYNSLYLNCCKALEKLLARLAERLQQCEDSQLTPLRKEYCHSLLLSIRDDLTDTGKVQEHSMLRIRESINVGTREKVLSIADRCASMICKGGREPVLGYKPQLARSGRGFVTAFEVEEGNPADSAALAPMVRQSIFNTGTVPARVSVDDGYSSAEGLRQVRDLGIDKVSISGAKGRKLLGQETWDSEDYFELRRMRSAVESTIYVLKHNHGFGQLGRRGLDQVRSECLEKILSHNIWRAVVVEQRLEKPPDKVAA